MFRILAVAALAALTIQPAPARAEEGLGRAVGEALLIELLRRNGHDVRPHRSQGHRTYTHSHGGRGFHEHIVGEPHGSLRSSPRYRQLEAEQHARPWGRPHVRGVPQGRVHPRHLSAPLSCYRDLPGPRGGGEGYSARCLTRNVAYPHLLPETCLRQVETWRGVRHLYSSRCLHRAGWNVPGARRSDRRH